MKGNNQLDRIERLLINYIECSTKRFSDIDDRFSSLEKEIIIVKEEIKDLGRNQRSMKLDLLDKLASKE